MSTYDAYKIFSHFSYLQSSLQVWLAKAVHVWQIEYSSLVAIALSLWFSSTEKVDKEKTVVVVVLVVVVIVVVVVAVTVIMVLENNYNDHACI